jgi:subtilisin family serine protease
MRYLRRIRILALTLSCTALAASSAGAGSEPSRELRAAAVRDGTVRVLVKIGQAAPEGALAGPAAVVEQRAAIAGAADVLASDLGGRDAVIVRRFATIPYVAVEAGSDGLDALAASGVVEAIVPDRLARPTLNVAGPLQQADAAWAAGFDGSGQTVAVLDTGTDTSHPFLAGKIAAEACFSANGDCPNGQTSQIGTGAGVPCTYAPDDCSHGTHVAGIVGGVGTDFSGIGKGAMLIPIQIFSRFSGNDCGNRPSPCALTFDSDQIAALEWVFQQRNNFTIAAANMSLGANRYSSQASCDADNAAIKSVIDNLRSVGIATIAAAGNEGSSDALDSPGCVSSVISVGATTRVDTIASFSNSATFLTLLAVGDPVLSSLPGGVFGEESGTSQATPMVSGAFTILRQKQPTATIDQIVAALQSTGLPITDPRNGIVKSRIRIKDALDALAPASSPAGVQITPDQRFHLVSKDVGSERWAITFDPATSNVTGNVFDASGGDPKFLSCTPLPPADGQSPGDILYSCLGADRCLASPCDPAAWTFVAQPTLPRSFFDPPPPTSATGAAAGQSSLAHAAGILARQSGVQITPDGSRTLISKDVAGQRWAIGREQSDGTVTGNVFQPSGGDPQFVYCTQLGIDPQSGAISLSCSGAGRCVAAPCTADQWTPIGDVTLPGSFFAPPLGTPTS